MTSDSSSNQTPPVFASYLDAVEQSLVRARATAADRQQIREDLESQILDMMTRAKDAGVEDIEQSILAELEDPSHFAEVYREQTQSDPGSSKERDNPWIVCAGCVFSLMVLMVLTMGLLGFIHAPVASGVSALFMPCLLLGVWLVPYAMRKGLQQLQEQPEVYTGSRLYLTIALSYRIFVPTTIFVALCVATQGYLLYPLGVIAFAYVMYHWVKKVRLSLLNLLPTESPPAASAGNNRGNAGPPAQNRIGIPWDWFKLLALRH